jgi:hypothetical protein
MAALRSVFRRERHRIADAENAAHVFDLQNAFSIEASRRSLNRRRRNNF